MFGAKTLKFRQYILLLLSYQNRPKMVRYRHNYYKNYYDRHGSESQAKIPVGQRASDENYPGNTKNHSTFWLNGLL